MKHANRIAFLVVVMILSAASQATAQRRVLIRPDWKCVAGEWNLPASRWEALAIVAGEAREQLDNIEELLDEAERYFEELAELRADDLMFEYAKDQFERQVADSQRGITYISLVEGRRVAAESLLATSEAFLAVSEALLAAAEGGDETALQVAVEAYNAISDAYAAARKAFSDILEIEDCVVPELCQGRV